MSSKAILLYIYIIFYYAILLPKLFDCSILILWLFMSTKVIPLILPFILTLYHPCLYCLTNGIPFIIKSVIRLWKLDNRFPWMCKPVSSPPPPVDINDGLLRSCPINFAGAVFWNNCCLWRSMHAKTRMLFDHIPLQTSTLPNQYWHAIIAKV